MLFSVAWIKLKEEPHERRIVWVPLIKNKSENVLIVPGNIWLICLGRLEH